MFKRLALPGLALALGLGIGFTLRAQVPQETQKDPILLMDVFQQVLRFVDDYYVDEVDLATVIENAIKGMLRSLDPYSDLKTPEEMKEFREETRGKYGGLGMEVGIRDGWPTVIAPFEGTPAWRSGLRPGDKIVEIEGESTYGMSILEVVKRLKGEPGTAVTIKVLKPGAEEPVELTITRELITIHTVQFWQVKDGIGYIRFTRFTEGASQELRAVVDSVLKKGARGLVLDLRTNPGGLFTESRRVADLFLPKGALIVSTKGRDPSSVENYFAQEPPFVPESLPVVVLVDRGSASASEIVAGALQDWDRALIIGDTTYGKGLVQRVFPLMGDYAITLTVSRYYTPSGRCINIIATGGKKREKSDTSHAVFYTKRLGRKVIEGEGIIPDIVIETEKLLPLTIRALGKGALFSYAVELHRRKPKPPAGGVVKLSRKDMEGLKKWLKEKGVEFTPCDWDEAYDQLKRQLEQELAEKYWGIKGRYSQRLVGDPMFEEALKRLKAARTLDDLFK